MLLLLSCIASATAFLFCIHRFEVKSGQNEKNNQMRKKWRAVTVNEQNGRSEYNSVDLNIINHTIRIMVKYSFIFLYFEIHIFQISKQLAVFWTLFKHYIIICFICKMSALNEEHYSDICKVVCNIYKYLYTKLAINTYINTWHT